MFCFAEDKTIGCDSASDETEINIVGEESDSGYSSLDQLTNGNSKVCTVLDDVLTNALGNHSGANDFYSYCMGLKCLCKESALTFFA